MPFMPCKHTGCNETVKVPNRYCHKHMVKPVAKTEEVKELLDIIKPKKTTK